MSDFVLVVPRVIPSIPGWGSSLRGYLEKHHPDSMDTMPYDDFLYVNEKEFAVAFLEVARSKGYIIIRMDCPKCKRFGFEAFIYPKYRYEDEDLVRNLIDGEGDDLSYLGYNPTWDKKLGDIRGIDAMDDVFA